MTYVAKSVDAAGVIETYRVTAGDPLRARELVQEHMLADGQRPKTILVCIPGGNQ